MECNSSRYTLPVSVKYMNPLASLAPNTKQVFIVKAWIPVVGNGLFASTLPNEIQAL